MLTPSTTFTTNLTPKAKALGSLKTGVKKVGKFLDTQFVEPTRKVNQIQSANQNAMAQKATSGVYNQ